MKILKTLALLAPLLAVGCVSATTHFGSRLERLEKTADIYVKKDVRYAPRFASEYTRFLAQLPSHPSLDGIRVHALEKRAQTYGVMKRNDLAAQDMNSAAEIKQSSPFFLSGGEPGVAYQPPPSTPGGPGAGAGPHEGPLVPPLPGATGVMPPRKRESRIKIDLSLGVAGLTRQHVRSDEVNMPVDAIDLDEDLGMKSVTGFPEISFLMTGRKMKAWAGLEFRWFQFNGEENLEAPVSFDGFTYATGDSVRSALRVATVTAFVRMVPLKKLEGKVDLDLGIRHYYIETEIESNGYKHVDALNVPLLFLGISVNQKIARHIELGGKLRTGASFWASTSTNMLALSFEFDAYLTFNLSDSFDLRFGILYDQMGFYENKSHDRRKEVALGSVGGFAEAGLKF